MTIGESLNKVEIYNENTGLGYPWRRYFARIIDLCFYGLILNYLSLIFHWNIDINRLSYILYSFLPFIVMLLFEPIFLSKIGTTMGKAVFGLIVRRLDNNRLTYKQACYRTFGVFRKGMGFHIPLFELFQNAQYYFKCKQHKKMPWDEDLAYFIKDKKLFRIIVCILIITFIMSLNVIISMEAQMPIYNGKITAQQYYENCNYLIKKSNLDFGRHMNEKGEWINNKRQTEKFLAELPLPKHELMISDGMVKGVRLEIETDNDIHTIGLFKQKEIIAKSFYAALCNMNCIEFMKSSILKDISVGFKNYTFIQNGIRITNQVELEGYETDDDWVTKNGRIGYIHIVFTMEKI